MPVEARQKTPDGATAFNKYYVDLMNRQAVSLDSAPLRDLSRGCENCTGLADTYDKMRTARQHYEGGDFTITSAGSTVVNGDEAETAFVLQEKPVIVRDAAGKEVPGRTHNGSRYTAGLRLLWDAERSTWIVAQFDADRF